MQQDYTDFLHTGNEVPPAVYHAIPKRSVTRRQYKHDMLLTFITYANTPGRKRKQYAAPVLQPVIRALRFLFL